MVPREGAVSVAFLSAGVVFLSPTVGPGCSLVAIVQLPAYLVRVRVRVRVGVGVRVRVRVRVRG